MTVFIDTSAFIAVLDQDDENHARARKGWEKLLSSEAVLLCSNYVLVETLALLQNRLGMDAVTAFQEDIAPLLTIEWIDAATHHAAVTTMIGVGRKKLSLVDCASFDVMRALGIRSAFTFDRHFKEQGFECLP